MNRLKRLIERHRWRESWRELLRALNTGALDVREYDAWGKYAGDIERGLKQRWTARERFWRELNRAIHAAEIREGVQTHKGLVYFKVGAMALFNGRKFQTVISWLERAYEEDKRLWHPRHERIPEHESAYRMLHIILALDQFSKESRDARQAVSVKGKQIGRFFGKVYDYTLAQPQGFPRLSLRAFDHLLRRNRYRVRVEQNYRAAEWMLGQKAQLLKTNLEQYGVAERAVVLCGTTIEGILLSKPRVRKGVPRGKRKRPALGDLALSYLTRSRPPPILTIGLVFIWYARNLIHPGRWKKLRKLTVDMNFADFTLSLTGSVIAQMAKRSRRGRTRL